MDNRVQLDAIISAIMTLGDEGVHVTSMAVNYDEGTFSLTVKEWGA